MNTPNADEGATNSSARHPTAPKAGAASDPYARPEKFCDLVMKGGITSGVVYPQAVCELAKKYSFKNIGGASAGAIAAATAAAAEYGRRMGANQDGSNGFARLEAVPGWLATNLASLFQPDKRTRPLYHLMLRAIGVKGGAFKKLLVLLPVAWWNFLRWAVLGFIVGALLLLPLADFLPTPAKPFAWWVLYSYGSFFALVFIILVITFFVVIGLIRKVTRALPENNYGLVSGLLDPQGADARPPLTTWMADELNRLAGKDRQHPLTFGDLRRAVGKLDRELIDKNLLDKKHGGINLEMMTTNLTLGRPYRLPFDKKSTEYFYNPAEWKELFPEYIVEWMLQHPRQPTHPPGARRERQLKEWESFKPCLPLPAPDDLPVVVAARMSLSFPVLISAVPLYTVDRSVKLADGELPRLERCLFSDGGISSNFPIHFFDKALPRWPTFGINLAPFNPSYPCNPEDQSQNSYLPSSNVGGLLDVWDRFDESESGFARLTGFFGALVNAMYNWADNTQMRVPGYRDRVITVFQTPAEGGLNLNMTQESIEALSQRGRFAGIKLRERFLGLDQTDMGWDNHRWVRYRSIMARIEETLEELRYVYQHPLPEEQTYAAMIARAPEDPPKSYKWKQGGQQSFAIEMTKRLIKLAEEWRAYGPSLGAESGFEEGEPNFREGEPNPAPELRVRPRI